LAHAAAWYGDNYRRGRPLAPRRHGAAAFGRDQSSAIADLRISRDDLARLSIPGREGTRPLVELIDALPSEMAAHYSDESHVRVSEPGRQARGCHLVDDDAYPELCELLYKRGMLSFDGEGFAACDGAAKPIYNGFFKIPKGDKFRLILDAQPANALLLKPSDPDLPNPESILRALRFARAQGLVGPSARLYKEDAADYYHCLRVPDWIRRYQCLRPLSPAQVEDLRARGVPIRDGECVPNLITLAMGLSHSVTLAQGLMAHQCQLTLAELTPQERARVLLFAYIDDVNVIADPHLGSRLMRMVRARLVALGLELKESKRVDGAEEGEVLGVLLQLRSGMYGVSPRRLVSIRDQLSELLEADAARGVSVRELEGVLGKVNWVALVRRPIYSFVFFCYKWSHVTVAKEGGRDRRHPLWKCVRKELQQLHDILPFCFASLWPARIGSVISDACSFGAGAGWTSATVPLLSADQTRKTPCPPGQRPTVLATPPDGFRFWQWRFTGTTYFSGIAVKELVAAQVGITRGLRTATASREEFKNFSVFCDNMNVVHLLQKGRSRSHSMNRVVRRHSALHILHGLSLDVYYVPTELNPADSWSRFEPHPLAAPLTATAVAAAIAPSDPDDPVVKSKPTAWQLRSFRSACTNL
jgi:hypothetical protein